jgi:hypothetical protein
MFVAQALLLHGISLDPLDDLAFMHGGQSQVTEEVTEGVRGSGRREERWFSCQAGVVLLSLRCSKDGRTILRVCPGPFPLAWIMLRPRL